MTQPEPGNTPARSGSVPLWVVIAVALAAVLFAVLIISRIAAPLAGLLNPAQPPFFQPATLEEHRSIQAGVDEWLYATEASGCEVALWYAERGDCRLTPGIGCGVGDLNLYFDTVHSIAYCTGSESFGTFTLHWEVYIHDGYTNPDVARFLVAGEVDWITPP